MVDPENLLLPALGSKTRVLRSGARVVVVVFRGEGAAGEMG